ncbi:MAG: sulfatase, partial [Actinomycetota bacterium]|nr:sulfatase [Actinomycetota bacterium]
MDVSRYSGAVLDRRDWLYSLRLLVPFVLYDLTLKALVIASFFGDQGLASTLDLMRSDAFFDLGYALCWMGLLAATCGGGFARRAVV